MALRPHFAHTEIGRPGIAELTVQRPKALFNHITGFDKNRLRLIWASVSGRLRWALHMILVFRAVVAFN